MQITKANITYFIGNSIFYLAPLIFGCLVYWFLTSIVSFNPTDFTVRTTILSALVGYSFTASFFLVALPRTGYLENLDKSHKTLGYAIALMLPAITGIFSLTFTFMIEQGLKDQSLKNLLCLSSDILFFWTISYFLFSVFLILRILMLIRKYS